MISCESWCLFLVFLWGQYHQILFNLIQLSNPPPVPLISAPRPFSQSLQFIRKTKWKNIPTFFTDCQWRSFKKPPFGMTWEVTLSYHVLSEHTQSERQICGSISASANDLHNDSYNLFCLQCKQSLHGYQRKLVECLLTSGTERLTKKLSNLVRGGIAVLGPPFLYS